MKSRVRINRGQPDDRWSDLYTRFERTTMGALTILIALVVVFALINLGKVALSLVMQAQLGPLQHSVFQSLFGEIMTVLIALEFKHSMLDPRVLSGGQSVIRARTVMLIALLAIARKFILLDLQHESVTQIYALTTTLIGLSVGYWAIGVDDRSARTADAIDQAKTAQDAPTERPQPLPR